MAALAALVGSLPAPSCDGVFGSLEHEAWLVRHQQVIECRDYSPLVTLFYFNQGGLTAAAFPGGFAVL